MMRLIAYYTLAIAYNKISLNYQPTDYIVLNVARKPLTSLQVLYLGVYPISNA